MVRRVGFGNRAIPTAERRAKHAHSHEKPKFEPASVRRAATAAADRAKAAQGWNAADALKKKTPGRRTGVIIGLVPLAIGVVTMWVSLSNGEMPGILFGLLWVVFGSRALLRAMRRRG